MAFLRVRVKCTAHEGKSYDLLQQLGSLLQWKQALQKFLGVCPFVYKGPPLRFPPQFLA